MVRVRKRGGRTAATMGKIRTSHRGTEKCHHWTWKSPTNFTNEFGEFHFELEAAEHLVVGIQVGDLCNIFLPLSEAKVSTNGSSDLGTN